MHYFFCIGFNDDLGYSKWGPSGVNRVIGVLCMYGKLTGVWIIAVVICCKGDIVGSCIG